MVHIYISYPCPVSFLIPGSWVEVRYVLRAALDNGVYSTVRYVGTSTRTVSCSYKEGFLRSHFLLFGKAVPTELLSRTTPRRGRPHRKGRRPFWVEERPDPTSASRTAAPAAPRAAASTTTTAPGPRVVPEPDAAVCPGGGRRMHPSGGSGGLPEENKRTNEPLSSIPTAGRTRRFLSRGNAGVPAHGSDRGKQSRAEPRKAAGGGAKRQGCFRCAPWAVGLVGGLVRWRANAPFLPAREAPPTTTTNTVRCDGKSRNQRVATAPNPIHARKPRPFL